MCDLQDFLQEFGQTKSGRKQDLVRRCQSTLQQVSAEKALTKLKDLSRRGRRGGTASPLPAPASQWTAHTAPELNAEESIAPFVESPFFKHVACIVSPQALGKSWPPGSWAGPARLMGHWVVLGAQGSSSVVRFEGEMTARWMGWMHNVMRLLVAQEN